MSKSATIPTLVAPASPTPRRRSRKLVLPGPSRSDSTWRSVRVNLSTVLLSIVVAGTASMAGVAAWLTFEPLVALPAAAGLLAAHRGLRHEFEVGRITDHGWSVLCCANAEIERISLLAQRLTPASWPALREDLVALHQELCELIILEGDIAFEMRTALQPSSRGMEHMRSGLERALGENAARITQGEAASARAEAIWRELMELTKSFKELERSTTVLTQSLASTAHQLQHELEGEISSLPALPGLPATSLAGHIDQVQGLTAGTRELTQHA